MKFPDGSLASSASGRFGQFSIQKTGDSNGEKVCSYNKRTFFSWTVHCLRFRFSKAYRKNVIAERLEILNALEFRCWQGQKISASDDSHDPNVTLSSRRRFNRRVSDLLRLDATSAEPGGTQATAAQQNLLYALGNVGYTETDRVLRPYKKPGGDQDLRHEYTAPPYVLQIVEDGLEAGYAANAPDLNGPDKNGDLCKHFLSYYTFTGDEGGEAGEKFFRWEAVSGKFDPSKAYPTIPPKGLSKKGWYLRVPSDNSIKYAAEIADAVREMTPDDALSFVHRKVLAKQGDAEERHIAHRFRAFLFADLGNALLAQDSAI